MKPLTRTSLIGFLILAPFFLCAPSANAATYAVTTCAGNSGDCAVFIYTVSLDKSTYAVNDPILASGTFVQGVCDNGYNLQSALNAQNDASGVSAPLFNESDWGTSGMATLDAGPSPISSSVTFSGSSRFADTQNGFDIATIPYTVIFPVPSVSCSGTPSNPYLNQPVTWSSSATGGSGSYSYSWSGDDGLSGTTDSVQKAYTTVGQKNATLAVTDNQSGQTTSTSCTAVDVGSCTASLTATSPVEQGQNTSLSWGVSGGSLCASSCSGSGFVTGGAISGADVPASVVPTPPSTSYSLTCSGGTYGPPPPANATVTVTVLTAVLTVNGQSDTARVNPAIANNATVVWSSSNASSCTVTKNASPWKTGLSSSGTLDSVTAQTVYTLDCQNKHGTHATASVIVNVLTNFQAF